MSEHTGEHQAGTGQDERRHARTSARLEAFLLFRGAWWRCWIRDLSRGGAGLEPAIPPALGQPVELASPRFDFDGNLRGRVVNLAHRRTCVDFELDPDMDAKLTRFLATMAGGG